MIEVRFHARRGRGAFDAARILAAAFRYAGKDASWLIPLGWEDAVNFEAALARADETSGKPREAVLAIFYPPLLEIPDIWMRFEEPNLVLVNTRNQLAAVDLCGGLRTAVVDAYGIARDCGPCFGIPGAVAPMLGALAGAGNIILGVHLIEALKQTARALRLPSRDLDRLLRGLEKGYEEVKIKGGSRDWKREGKAAKPEERPEGYVQ